LLWPYFVGGTFVLSAAAVALLVWPTAPRDRREITQADALDALADGFERWEYTHPGVLTFTLPDGRKVEVEDGPATGRWWLLDRDGA
jgi:hypothetical protein